MDKEKFWWNVLPKLSIPKLKKPGSSEMSVSNYTASHPSILRAFFIDINITPHYRVILQALHNLSFRFTITFTFNNHKTTVEVHYNVDNNILTSSLIINNIYTHSLRSIYLSTYLSFIVERHCKSVKSRDLTNLKKICK